MSDMIVLNAPMQLPAHLAGVNLGVTDKLMEGIFQGGDRIGLKGSRFRLIVNGKEEHVREENYLDVILLNAAPAVSRAYYAQAYKQGENQAPACYSADGIVPCADAKSIQNDKCATCPQNIKGSKIADGNQYKACGYFRRLVIMLAGDTEHRRVYKLDVKSQGLWGEGAKFNDGSEAFALNEYLKAVSNRGLDLGLVVTRLSFDTNSSTPKLLFRPSRFVDAAELTAVQSLVGTDEVVKLAEVTMATVDLSGEEPTAGDTQQEATQAPAAQTATPVAQTATQAAPVQTQAPAAQSGTVSRPTPPPAQQAAKPAVQVESNVPVPQTAAQIPTQTATAPVVEVQNNQQLAEILAGLE